VRASGGRRRTSARSPSAPARGLRALVADYEAGERCRGMADDLAAHVAGDEQSEWVRRHLSNCPSCAHTARELELERVARGARAAAPAAHARP
jgi:hypothetical protein